MSVMTLSSEHPKLNTSFFTIGRKLIALMMGLSLVTVIGLTIFLTIIFLDEAEYELESKANLYGRVLSAQARSTVASNDHEFAIDLFKAISLDPDVTAIGLFRNDGKLLYKHGELSDEAKSRAKVQHSQHTTITLASEILTFSPISLREGHSGVMVVSISKDILWVVEMEALLEAFIACLITSICSFILAYFSAKPLARRIQTIAQSAHQMASGNFDAPKIVDHSRDEIGILTQSFNWMIDRIRNLVDEIKENAQNERTRLEATVTERTKELAKKNDSMQMVLDNVQQGLFTIDRLAHISAERSTILEKWWGPVPNSENLWDYLDTLSPGIKEFCELAWQQVLDEDLPTKVALEMIPHKFLHEDRIYHIEYSEIKDNNSLFLVIVTDITDACEKEAAEEEQREISTLCTKLVNARSALMEFVQETTEIIKKLEDPDTDLILCKRLIHTLKGNSAIYHLHRISRICHELETHIEETRRSPTPEELQILTSTWTRTTSNLNKLTLGNTSSVELSPDEHRDFLDAIVSRTSPEELYEISNSWQHDRISHRLQRFADSAKYLAVKLGKGQIETIVDCGRIRLPLRNFAPFWASFSHLVRNAVDHGIAFPDKQDSNDTWLATLTFHCSLTQDAVVIAVQDNGPGIDWDKLSKIAEEKKVHYERQEDLVNVLFLDGVSTRDHISELSGRGIGLAAVRAACIDTGGTINVISQPGQGTRFEARWPIEKAKDNTCEVNKLGLTA